MLTPKEKRLGLYAAGIGIVLMVVPLLLLFAFSGYRKSTTPNTKQATESKRPTPPDTYTYTPTGRDPFFQSKPSLIEEIIEEWVWVFRVLFGLVICAIPPLIAYVRKHASWMAITVLSLVLGWTVVGWVIAMIWALANKGQGVVVVINNPGQDPQVVINNPPRSDPRPN